MSAGGNARFVVNTQCAVSRAGRYLMIVRGEGVRQAPGVLAFPGARSRLGTVLTAFWKPLSGAKCWKRPA